jgi:uncharacterized membrane protein required for colicin V production
MLDLAALALVALFGLLGLLSGLLIQVLRLAAATLAVYVALQAAQPVMEAWPGLLAAYPAVRQALFPVGIFAVVYGILALVARLVVKLLHRASTTLTTADRALGLIVGMAKGAIIAYFLAALLLAVEARSGRPIPHLETEGSRVAGFVREHPIGVAADLDEIRRLTGVPFEAGGVQVPTLPEAPAPAANPPDAGALP